MPERAFDYEIRIYMLLSIFFNNDTNEHGEFFLEASNLQVKIFGSFGSKRMIYRTFYGLFIIVQISRKNYAFDVPSICIPRILSGAICLMLQ